MYGGTEVLKSVAMKSNIFWDIMLQSPIKVKPMLWKNNGTSIFLTEEYAKLETRMKPASSRAEMLSDS
jgi:hypothetical protein